jgi:ribosome-binding ATPase YchF (GTP1/OBG family)
LFDNDNIVHVDGNVNLFVIKDHRYRVAVKDLENVEKRLEKVKRAAKTGNKEAIVEETLLNRIRETLLQAKSVRTYASKQ